MNEDELKATIGEAAFNAMTPESRAALLGKFTPPKKEEPPKKKDDEEADDEDESDLRTKAAKGKQSAEEKALETRSIEGALKFNLGVQDFVKTNSDLLPSEIGEILKTAEKETYDSAIEKAGAMKSAFIQAFFSVQENVDALTASQKTQLDDFLKLTKTGKEAKAASIYENIFEPALETLRKVKKAVELGKARNGFATGNAVQDGYKQRLMKIHKSNANEKGV